MECPYIRGGYHEPITRFSPFGGVCVTSKKRLRGRLTTDEQIKIFVTENTESDTFCMEE